MRHQVRKEYAAKSKPEQVSGFAYNNATPGISIIMSISKLYLYAVMVSMVPSVLYLSSVTFTQRKYVLPPESVLSW